MNCDGHRLKYLEISEKMLYDALGEEVGLCSIKYCK